MTVLAILAGMFGAVGLAGLVRDRARGRRRTEQHDPDGTAGGYLRYHRDVRESHEHHSSIFGGPPL